MKSDDLLFENLINSISPILKDRTFILKKKHEIKNRVCIENCTFWFKYKGLIRFTNTASGSIISNNYFYGTQKNNISRTNLLH
jgi:hypothetical protein